MKKNYLLTLILAFTVVFVSSAQVTELFISKYGEGTSNNKFLEIYNGTDATISLSDYAFPTVSNAPSTPGEYEYWNKFDEGAEIAPGDVYVIANPSADASILAEADQTYTYLSNGDDGLALVGDVTYDAAGEVTGYTILDWLGDWQGDPGSGWEVAGVSNATANHTLTRKSTVCGPNNDWAASAGTNATDSEWIVGESNSGWDTIGSFEGCASGAGLSINSPSNNQVFESTTTDVSVSITISNFTLSADNGSGASDGSGDGYIKSTLTETGQTDQEELFFSATLDDIAVVSGRSYSLTLELVDNDGNSLTEQVSASTSFSVELPCALELGSINTVCDDSPATTYSGTIAFTGGNTGVDYAITAPSGVTIGGDDPDTVAEGTITFSNMTQGTDVSVNISGDSTSGCDFDRTLYSPACASLPFSDAFYYTVGANLSDDSGWTDINSGDNIVVASESLDYTGLAASTGNSITFDEAGKEAYTEFADITSGSVYASFLFRVTAFQTSTSPDLTDGGYFAALAGGTTSYDARLWVRPNPDTDGTLFDIGFGHESSSPTFTSETYDFGVVIFVVMSYDIDNGQTNVWINPDPSTFGNTPPTATINTTDSNAASKINLFILRQDSNKETPFLQIDELRIDSSWASVTPASGTASTSNNTINGFNVYPNPVKGNSLTVTTSSTEVKTVNIFNVLGRKVFSQRFSSMNKTMDISGISSGVYIMKVSEGNNIATKKLIIE